MAITGNSSAVLGVLSGAAGKNNYGAGGDFFTPGKHKVRVTETTAGQSDQRKNVTKVIIASDIVDSQPGESNWVLENGKAERRGTPVAVPGISPGSSRKQILMSDKGNFDSDLGNFCLAAKKTFAVMYHLCKECDNLDEFLKERWAPSVHSRIHEFVKRAAATGDTTVQQDITDIFELDLANGLVMHVDCGDKSNKDKTIVLNQVAWRAGTAEDQAGDDE